MDKKATKKNKKQIDRDEILGNQEENEKVFPQISEHLLVFQIENKLRQSCKLIMEPVVEQQEKISLLIKNINTNISNMKADIENNGILIGDLKNDMKKQFGLNQQFKKNNLQRSQEIDKLGKFLTSHNEKITDINNSIK